MRHSRPRATFSLVLLLSALIFNAAARSEEPGRAAAPLANPVAEQPLELLPAIVDRSLDQDPFGGGLWRRLSGQRSDPCRALRILRVPSWC